MAVKNRVHSDAMDGAALPGADAGGGMAKPGRGLDRSTQSTLGTMLRLHYDDLAREPLPDRLKTLLSELEQREQQQSAPDGSDLAPDQQAPDQADQGPAAGEQPLSDRTA